MKIKINLLVAVLLQGLFLSSLAQTNTFPATGNAGIGTLTPTEKLSVLTATASPGISHSDGTVKLGTYIGSGVGYLGTFTNHPLCFRTNNGAAQITLLQNGRVGIGTTAPSGLLDVSGGDAFIQGVRAGLGNGNDTTNTVLGRNALKNNLSNIVSGNGVFNTAIGLNALKLNAGGFYNTAVGAGALESNAEAPGNSAVGSSALGGNTDGAYNTALGNVALRNNTTGNYNVAVGNQSLFSNSTGESNTAAGESTLDNNTTGSHNSAFGSYALQSNTQGNFNTAAGYFALLQNTTGNNNNAVGNEALKWNITGNENTAIGFSALDSNKSGSQNTAAGARSLYNSTTGNWNTAIGRYALYYNKTGSENSGLGDDALYLNTTGTNNTGVGYSASPNTGALNNTTAIGYNATTTASNQMRIGNSAVTSIGGYTNWTNISDGRVKKNIKENVPGLVFINQLKPVTYNLNLTEADKIINKAPAPGQDKKNEKALQEAARTAKEQIIYTGFIAQEVEKAAKSLNYDFSGVDVPKNEMDLYGLRYAEFVVPLVKSVQELSKLNTEKDEKINDLQKQIDELKILITGNKKNAGASVVGNEQLTSASLEQNVPNPFTTVTTVGYELPENAVSAKIIITDKSGRACKEINISGKGKGSVQLNTATLSAGTYQYSLYVNDHLIETRQMILLR